MRAFTVLTVLLIAGGLLAGCLIPGTGLRPADAATPAEPPPGTPLATPEIPPPETTAAPPLPTLLPIRGDASLISLSFSFNSGGMGQKVTVALDPAALPSRGG